MGVRIAQLCGYSKWGQLRHFKWEDFAVYKIYSTALQRAVKKFVRLSSHFLACKLGIARTIPCRCYEAELICENLPTKCPGRSFPLSRKEDVLKSTGQSVIHSTNEFCGTQRLLCSKAAPFDGLFPGRGRVLALHRQEHRHQPHVTVEPLQCGWCDWGAGFFFSSF